MLGTQDKLTFYVTKKSKNTHFTNIKLAKNHIFIT